MDLTNPLWFHPNTVQHTFRMQPHASTKYRSAYRSVAIAACCASSLVWLAGCGQQTDSKELAIQEGLEALQYYDYNLAETKLSKVQPLLDPGSERWIEITFATAVAAWHSSPPSQPSTELAQDLFESILEAGASPQVTALAMINLARIAEVADYPRDPVELETARRLYAAVIEKFPDTAIAGEATLRLAQTYAQELDHSGVEKAIQQLTDYLEQHPESEWRSVIAQYRGDLYIERLNEPTLALESYQLAEASGFANETKEDIYFWRMAKLAQRTGKARLAAEYYKALVENYPRSQFGWFAANEVRTYNKNFPDAPIEMPEIQNAFSN